MKQVIIRKGHVLVENQPTPLVEDGFILVEVAYSLISAGTEISSVASSGTSQVKSAMKNPARLSRVVDTIRRHGIQKTVALIKDRLDSPTVTGYSCSGKVLQVGNHVEGIYPGDLVACAGAGLANHAEIVVVPRNLVVKIPKNCSLKDAASVTLGSIALQGVRRADLRLGEIVAVIGLGLLGQLTIQLLNASGCRVIGIDIDERRVQLASQLGVSQALNSSHFHLGNEILHLTAGHGVDATIITAGSSSDSIVQQAMEITRKKGRVVVVGAVGLGLQRSPFYEKEIDFLISCSYGPGRYDEKYERKGMDYPYPYVRWTENRNMQEYLHLIADGKICLDNILEREFEISQATQAYAELNQAADKPLGVVLRYPSSDAQEIEKKMLTCISLPSKKMEGKIRVALIGAGNFAKTTHLPNLQKLSNLYTLRAVVDINGSNAKATAERYGAAYASTNYEDALADDQVDLVMITTRHNTHAEIAMAAAKAGKAIFVEKPMAINQAELDDLVKVLEETQVPYMVGFNRRFSPAAQRAKEIISGRTNPMMILYRMNAGYLPPEHWTQTEEGGGRIIGEACHIFDLFHYLIDSPVLEINATSIGTHSAHILAGDNTVITIKYQDGSVATLLYTAIGSPDFRKEYMELYSDGKILVLDDYLTLQIYGSKIKGYNAAMQDKGHHMELSEFGQCLKNQAFPPIELSNLIEVTGISILVNSLIKSDLKTN